MVIVEDDVGEVLRAGSLERVLRILCVEYEVLKTVELGWQHSDQGWLSGKVCTVDGVFIKIRPKAPL